jgi:predicted nucleic acid-binding protein
MTDRHFFDTNILIYAFDSSEPAKQQIAVNRIDAAVRNNSGVISTQVLGEFFHSLVVRKRLLAAAEAERAINDFASGLARITTDRR